MNETTKSILFAIFVAVVFAAFFLYMFSTYRRFAEEDRVFWETHKNVEVCGIVSDVVISGGWRQTTSAYFVVSWSDGTVTREVTNAREAPIDGHEFCEVVTIEK